MRIFADIAAGFAIGAAALFAFTGLEARAATHGAVRADTAIAGPAHSTAPAHPFAPVQPTSIAGDPCGAAAGRPGPSATGPSRFDVRRFDIRQPCTRGAFAVFDIPFTSQLAAAS